VWETKPEKKYILAMDLTPDRKQQSLIQAISAGVGTGLVASTAEYSQIDDEKIRED
jgi:hypothetical protein